MDASIGETISCDDGVASLFRAAELAEAAAKRCADLEAEVVATEAAVPCALARARDAADEALSHLADVDERRAAFEAVLKEHLIETPRIAASLGAPCARLQRLKDAHLVLHVLVSADQFSRDVESALQSVGEQQLRAGASSATIVALLRLHALRVCVRGGATDAVGASLVARLDEQLTGLQASILAALRQRVERSLESIGWPLKSSCGRAHDAEQRELHAALGEMLLLQYVCEAPADVAPDAVASAVVGALDSADGAAVRSPVATTAARLWAVDALLAPLLKRFRYHFEERRETNRRDKPEWMFGHVVGLLRLHWTFLSSLLPPVVRTALPLLREALATPEAAQSEAAAFKAMLSARGSQGAHATVAAGLCEAVRRKLVREQGGLRAASTQLFCHTLNETVAFEREMKESLGLPSRARGVLRVFFDTLPALQVRPSA